jgi:hypothetical protein
MARRRVAPGLALAIAVLIGAACAAGCSSGPGTGTTSATAPPGSQAYWPQLTLSDAQSAYAGYVNTSNLAARTGDKALAQTVVQGMASDTLYTEYAIAQANHLKPPYLAYSYGTPKYYLPQPPPAGQPQYFVVSVTRSPVPGTTPMVPAAQDVAADVQLSASGTVLMLFEKSASGGRWQVASISQLAPGESVPALATDQHGYVILDSMTGPGTQLVSPTLTPPLAATVVDDGPASPAAQVVASGPLTTGLYQLASTSTRGLAAPPGDVYEWLLEGSSYGRLSLQTADGGSLVLYAMYFNRTVQTPSSLNQDVPVRSGPTITVPDYVKALLSQDKWTPTTKLQTQDILSFAAIDPPAADKTAKIQVIAIGGGIRSALSDLSGDTHQPPSVRRPRVRRKSPSSPGCGSPGTRPTSW